MKKLLVLMLTLVLFTGCTPEEKNSAVGISGTFVGQGNGFGGNLEVEIVLENGQITDLSLLENSETLVVSERAFPIIKERIINENSPAVDTVTAATFTSFGVKIAVADALNQAEIQTPEITFSTSSLLNEDVVMEDTTTQLVVIGGGPAGLTAAIAAKENGVDNVIVIEKLDILSGNGKFDRNFFDLYNSEAQKISGYEDSMEQWLDYKSTADDTPERILAWAEETYTLDAWLRGIGIELDYNYQESRRSHMKTIDDYAGAEIQKGLENRINELGIEVRTGTKGLDFIFEDDTIVGVVAEYKDVEYNIYADATILATGGFSSNKELLAQYAPGSEVMNTSNQIGTTGDFVPLFEKYGFQTYQMGKLAVFKSIIVPTRDLTHSDYASLWVNGSGERFTNETIGNIANGSLVLEQDVTWLVTDIAKVDQEANVRKQYKEGKYYESETLEGLAEIMNVPYENLLKEFTEYNEAANNKTEDRFGCTPKRALAETGPYIATKVESAVHMTKGGVVTNEFAQVVREDKTTVSGLYAAGEVTYQTGAYEQSVAFGSIAGKSAANALLD